MNDRLFTKLIKIHRQEKGEIILITLAFMILGFLLIVPMVSYMGTGLKSGMFFDEKSEALYAADAGVEDAMWKIKYGHLASLDNPSAYDEYNFSTSWQYQLPEQKNGKDVDVTIQNLWMPKNISLPAASTARAAAVDDSILVTTGTVSGAIQSLKITLTYNAEVDKTLEIDSIGIWLPPGFSYTANSSNLEESGHDYTTIPVDYEYQGGHAIIWTFADSIDFTSLPGVDVLDNPLTSDITFDFSRSGNAVTQLTAGASSGATSITVASTSGFPTAGSLILPNESKLITYTAVTATTFSGIPSSGSGSITTGHSSGQSVSLPTQPDAVSWMTGKEVDLVNEVSLFAWDIDVKVFKIHSEAGGTEVDTFLSKRELRKQSGAINGEYYATGNSLLKDTNSDNYRDTVVDPSTASVTSSNIPSDAEVAAAYLYWSAWRSASPTFYDASTSTNLSTNLWTNGGDWAYINTSPYYYQGHHSGIESRRYVTQKTAVNLSSYEPRMVTLDWDQWITTPINIWTDGCTDLSTTGKWDRSGTTAYNNTAWGVSSSTFRGRYAPSPSPGPTDYTYLTLKSGVLSLASANGDTVNLTWKQWKYGTLTEGDKLYYAFSNDNFATSSGMFDAGITNNSPTSKPGSPNFTVAIPQTYLTDTMKIRFYLVGFANPKYCYLDDITVTPAYSSADGLDVDLSADNGTTWWGDSHSLFQAFRGNIGASSVHYSLTIPSGFLTSQFKMRLRLVGMNAASLYCNIDNVSILVPDHQIVFKINGSQVYMDAEGLPQSGSSYLKASEAQIMRNLEGSTYKGYSYSCYRDVTDLVRKYSTKADDPATNYPGWGTYEVREVDASTADNWSYAGWSLVIVYTSAETLGHQLFLYDQLAYGGENSDVDFDRDGQAGGIISGFVVPARVQNDDGSWETNAAKLTCFVGEGDAPYTNDYITINGSTNYLSNSSSPYNNVWNSASHGVTAPGLDIDTFYITWTSGYVSAGDTTAQIHMPTGTDSWNLVYIILSFRNETVTGGSMTYLIRG